MKILVTGGPVHGYLDAVKMITNRFRGGLMVDLAERLALDVYESQHDVIYLTTKFAEQPRRDLVKRTVHHDGIHDYMAKVLEIAPTVDAVVLGAAVANLIPVETIKGKFPSHNYKPGDVIPINFTIAPRIIDAVKEVAPRAKLFGFKLLAGVSQDELVKAAYDVVLHSKATAVFANQTADLKQKYMITRERGVIPMDIRHLPDMILLLTSDVYYTTKSSFWISANRPEMHAINIDNIDAMKKVFHALRERYQDRFIQTPEGYLFGTIAIADGKGGFLTTSRGKNELDDFAYVYGVDHDNRVVNTANQKATLNAPLLDRLFARTGAKAIVHTHEIIPSCDTLAYAPAGTVRDTMRTIPPGATTFNIDGHGHFILLFEHDMPAV